MMIRWVRFGLALVPAAMCIGCNGGSLSLAYHDSHHVVEPVHVRPVHVRPVHVDIVERPHVSVIHVCTHDCHNHYWDGAKLVVIARGHRHGANCGHHWSGRRWVVVAARGAHRARVRGAHDRGGHGRDVHIRGPRGRSVHIQHVHGPRCGCAFDRHHKKWIVIGTGHVHRRGCGHVFAGGRWSIRH